MHNILNYPFGTTANTPDKLYKKIIPHLNLQKNELIISYGKKIVIFGDNLKNMARQIIFFQNHFIEFYKDLEPKVKDKIKYTLELIKQVDNIPEKFFAPTTGCDGLFEVRIEYQSNIYRIFCCFDHGKIIVLFNAFQKKTQKTPKKEIERAMRLKHDYFKSKKPQQ